MKINNLGEFGFIDRIKKGCLNREEGVIAGIGDDCAVFRVSDNRVILVTTDMLIEDVHFRRDEIPPEFLGRKSLGVSISDIAAMGGVPREAFVSIGIPGNVEIEYLDKIYEGMKSIAAEYEINLLGGDTVSSPDRLVINIALTGEAPEDEILYRKGAQVDDIIFITGKPGVSSAGLDLLRYNREFENRDILLKLHFNPIPHVKAGRLIASSKKANSLIDVSDGLTADLWHICEESGVGAIIEMDKIPVADALKEYCHRYTLKIEDIILHGGEDYMLLGTVPDKSSQELERILKSGGCSYFPIGKIVGEKSMSVLYCEGDTRPLNPRGHDHFCLPR
ncbi:MAG: thiamine-phosphate kinase [candidate division Zixibacteria bacterium]